MKLDQRGDIAIAEIVLYVPILLVSIALVLRYGAVRKTGWIFFAILSIVRIVGGVIHILWEQNPSSKVHHYGVHESVTAPHGDNGLPAYRHPAHPRAPPAAGHPHVPHPAVRRRRLRPPPDHRRARARQGEAAARPRPRRDATARRRAPLRPLLRRCRRPRGPLLAAPRAAAEVPP